ncbi:MAG TPA: DUF983 domain-containing protein [Rhizomicrobium sp.]|jgi:uncharacterized protein (DUF983 family)|nr:DUF983 domain-containing protein [Rhizomicrobium sp.]
MAAGPSVVVASLLGRCPRCGQGRLFAGYLAIAPACTACGQDFSAFDVGDGAAALVILVVGAIVCGLALWTEFTFSPPLWLHAVLWAPLICVLTFVFLRLIKSALLVLQYRHKAGEGRVL